MSIIPDQYTRESIKEIINNVIPTCRPDRQYSFSWYLIGDSDKKNITSYCSLYTISAIYGYIDLMEELENLWRKHKYVPPYNETFRAICRFGRLDMVKYLENKMTGPFYNRKSVVDMDLYVKGFVSSIIYNQPIICRHITNYFFRYLERWNHRKYLLNIYFIPHGEVDFIYKSSYSTWSLCPGKNLLIESAKNLELVKIMCKIHNFNKLRIHKYNLEYTNTFDFDDCRISYNTHINISDAPTQYLNIFEHCLVNGYLDTAEYFRANTLRETKLNECLEYIPIILLGNMYKKYTNTKDIEGVLQKVYAYMDKLNMIEPSINHWYLFAAIFNKLPQIKHFEKTYSIDHDWIFKTFTNKFVICHFNTGNSAFQYLLKKHPSLMNHCYEKETIYHRGIKSGNVKFMIYLEETHNLDYKKFLYNENYKNDLLSLANTDEMRSFLLQKEEILFPKENINIDDCLICKSKLSKDDRLCKCVKGHIYHTECMYQYAARKAIKKKSELKCALCFTDMEFRSFKLS